MTMAQLLAILCLAFTAAAGRAPLRICADPNNLPFSDEQQGGLEERMARILADELGLEVQVYYWPERRGFLRNTLKAGHCDVVMGLPVGSEMVATTRPVYRSRYAFVSRKGELDPPITSFDDPRLRRLRLGVQLVGDDGANPPPAHALGLRGIVDNVKGYPVTGDWRDRPPTGSVLEALEHGDIDVAIVWGPLGGWWARHRARVPLLVSPTAQAADNGLPLEFAIALGVRKSDDTLRQALDRALIRKRAAIDRLLAEEGVP